MTRAFLALLLANLGWIAWAQWLAPPAGAGSDALPVRASTAAVGSGRIQLVGEAGVEDPRRADSATAAARCLAVGPFRDAAAVSAALEYFERHGHAPRPRPGAEYWIEIRVETPMSPAGAPGARFWEHPDMTTAEHAAMGEPGAWQFAPCEPQAGEAAAAEAATG